jgi:acetoin utilization deacetylase AcuC-like enzyme
VDAVRLAASRARTALRNLGLPIPVPGKIVYHPDYVTSRRDGGARHAFDLRRSAKLMEQLDRAGILSRTQILVPDPAPREVLELVHPSDYLDQISVPGRLADLLFLPRDVLPDSSLLDSFLLQTGGTVLAAERSVRDRVPVFNLGGGFHHAQRDRAEGFCAINDVAVAVRWLQHRGLARRVLIIDLDYHPGNGTALIFEQDESVFTLSVHGQTWDRAEGKQNNLDVELPPGTTDRVYQQATVRAVNAALSRFRADAAIYIAGADVHTEDRLGDFDISDEGMLDRDLFVWRTLREAGVPFAVVLGGGYSPFAWAVAYNFIFSALTGLRIRPEFRPGNIEARYRRAKSRLSPGDLRRGHAGLEMADLDQFTGGKGASSALFMGCYTAAGLELALEHYGFLDLLRDKGFEHLVVSVHTSDLDRQIARIHFDVEDPAHLLVELVTRFRTVVSPPEAISEGAEETYRVLSIEWLLMRNPRAHFSLDRRKLPGQEVPGLGLGRFMLELLRMMAERLDCHGLMNVPDHYHNAYLYSKQMLFFDPEEQGRLEAMKRDLVSLPLVEASMAIDEGRLRDAETGAVVLWEGKPQVMPVKASLNVFFTRPSYIRAVSAARQRYHFRVEP